MRNFLFGAFQLELWTRLQESTDSELAGIAAKSVKETRYHLRHAAGWVVRLGDGTDESHARTQAALEYLWPYTAEFFGQDEVDEAAAAAGIGVACSALETPWQATVAPVLDEARLRSPPRTAFRSRGKSGAHSEHMGHLLAELQYLQRAYPNGIW